MKRIKLTTEHGERAINSMNWTDTKDRASIFALEPLRDPLEDAWYSSDNFEVIE